jgi:hypothetical protein
VEGNVGGRWDMRSLAPAVGMVSNVASGRSLWRRQHLLGRTEGGSAAPWHLRCGGSIVAPDEEEPMVRALSEEQ